MLDRIIDLGHPLVRLADEIDWGFLDGRFSSVCAPGAGQPGLPTRLVAGLFILKHMHNLSDEVLCARWIENPYYQYFCGELGFCHQLPFDRSSLTRWRQRLIASWFDKLTMRAVLAAGYNFGLLLRWLAALLRALIRALAHSAQEPQIA